MSNDDKILQLLETMYREMNQRFDKIEIKVDENSKEIQENRKAIINMENNLTEKIRGLYDNREVVKDKLEEMNGKLDKLQVDVNSLTARTAYNENRIIELSRRDNSTKVSNE